MDNLIKKLNLFSMLKLLKIEKNTLIYRSMPFLVFVLKWIDNKLNSLLKKTITKLVSLTAWYNKKFSKRIETLYTKKSITKIKPKYPKVKKKVGK